MCNCSCSTPCCRARNVSPLTTIRYRSYYRSGRDSAFYVTTLRGFVMRIPDYFIVSINPCLKTIRMKRSYFDNP